MFLAKTSATAADFVGNLPTDNVNWAVAYAGVLVLQVSQADFAAARAWRDAADLSDPVQVPDADGRLPGAQDYVLTFAPEPSYWIPRGNQVCVLADGSVELRDPAGVLQSTLTGTVVQAAS